jgi:hypothetical protein
MTKTTTITTTNNTNTAVAVTSSNLITYVAKFVELHGEPLRISPSFLLSLRFWIGMRKKSLSSSNVSYIAAHLPSNRRNFEVCGRQNDPS